MDSLKIYLVQTDTTAGFLSSSCKKLSTLKQRDISKKTLQVVDSFETLKENTRIPQRFKKLIRRAKNRTFIYPNTLSFRVIPNSSIHHNFIKKFKILYSTSANITNEKFNEEFARNSANIIVENKNGFFESSSSKIYKISNKKIAKIR